MNLLNLSEKDKGNLLIAGFAFVLLVLMVRNKQRQGMVHSFLNGSKNFDGSSLPDFLKPPIFIADGEDKPIPARREFSFNNFVRKPRFDGK